MARISIIEGREARLNKAILCILDIKGPLKTCHMAYSKTETDLAYIRHRVVNRRVRDPKVL